MHPVFALLQAEEHSVTIGGVALEYLGFVASFLIFGAIGFALVVLRPMRARVAGAVATSRTHGAASDHGLHETLQRRAASMGAAGALALIAFLCINAGVGGMERGQSFLQAIAHPNARALPAFIYAPVMLVLFALARRMSWAWPVAAIAAVLFTLRGITGGWTRVVNPVHEMAASLWLGTLLVLLVVGIGSVLASSLAREARPAVVAEMVRRFSPLALTSVGVLGISGVVTAWRHLKHLEALWTTPYGYALDAKLVVVACVLALGAWNWRRVTPRLEEVDGPELIRRSSRTELAFGAVVLLLTAILISLPAPRFPGEGGPPTAGQVPVARPSARP